MEYKVVIVDANKLFGSDFEKAGEMLSEEVNAHLAEGWKPQGGVCYTLGVGMTKASLVQALVRE